jgi:hypothetical protein
MKTAFKMKNKPDSALLRASYISNEMKKGQQNLVRLSTAVIDIAEMQLFTGLCQIFL